MSLTPSDILQRIRFDPGQKIGSVYDVIQLVTGCAKKDISHIYQRMCGEFPEVTERIGIFKFKGQGQRPTPVADMTTLFRIISLCPGRGATKFKTATMDIFTRAFGADLALAREIEDRRTWIVERGMQVDNVHTQIDDATIEPPSNVGPIEGMVYIATSPCVGCLKVGYWTGTIAALETRYRTYYGRDTLVHTWPCQDCRAVEKWLIQEFSEWSMGGELLDKECLPDFLFLLGVAEML